MFKLLGDFSTLSKIKSHRSSVSNESFNCVIQFERPNSLVRVATKMKNGTKNKMALFLDITESEKSYDQMQPFEILKNIFFGEYLV